MDDSELLQLYVQGHSESAFTELVNRHLDVVFSAACRHVGGDVHRARDVAQEVFADLARKAPSLTGHTALVGWLYTSTHFAAGKVRRYEQRRAKREKEAHAMNELSRSSPDQVDWELLRPVIDAAMHELKERDRSAVLLRFFEKRSFADVGRHLSLGENAARMTVERALDKLGGLLARRGITSTAAALSLALTQQAVATAPTGLAGAIASGVLSRVALAGSGGLGTLVGTTMTNTKLTLGVAAVVGLLALSTVIITETRAARFTAQLAGLTQETSALTARAHEIEARLITRSDPTPTPAVTAVPSPPAALKRDEYLRAALRDPTSIRLFAQLYRVNARRQYAALYRQLGWGPAQIEQFETIFEESVAEDLRTQGGGDINAGALTLTPEVVGRLERIRSEFEHQLRTMFGEGALQQFLAYDRTSVSRMVADEVAGRVYLTATPLTAAQADELVSILESSTPVSDHSRTVPHPALNWDQVLMHAQGVLTPAQLNALKGIRLKAQLDAILFPEDKR
jgi:RNA polymerase sigma factor (sigma-70 family)